MRKKIDMNLVKQARANLDKVREQYPDTRAMDEAEIELITSNVTSRQQPITKTTLSPAEVARLLGTHKETILRAIRKGDIKAALLGRMYRITKTEVNRYFMSKGGTPLFEEGGQNERQE